MTYLRNLIVGLFECCSWGLRHVIDFVFAPISKGEHCRGAYAAVRIASIRRAMWPERVEASED